MNKMINILFTGDFAPCRGFEAVVLDKKEQILGDALPLIKSADLSFANLECPLTDHNIAINKSGPALKAKPACSEALKSFSVVGLANNHILDYGKQGLVDTIAACNKIGLPTVGAGVDLKQAQRPFVKKINGIKFAIIAIAEHEFNQSEKGGAGSAPIDPIDNYRQIQEAKSEADVVIVTIHGGNELFPYPRPGLRKLCQFFIDLGVEAVICHHPHVPGAYEFFKGKPILYSLGNFIFDSAYPPKDWNVSYMAQLKFCFKSKQFKSIELIPYKQCVDFGGVSLLKDHEKAELLRRIEIYRQKLEDKASSIQEWENFVAQKSDSYLLRHFFPVAFRGLGFLARNTPITKLFFRSKHLDKLNMLRCQSHLELLTAVMESKSKQRND